MPQAIQRLVLNLPDTLTGQTELLPDLFQRIAAPIVQAKAQPQDTRLTRRQAGENIIQLFLQQAVISRIRGRRRILIRDKAAQLLSSSSPTGFSSESGR